MSKVTMPQPAAKVREALREPSAFDSAFALTSAWMRSTQAIADMGQVAVMCSLVEFALLNQGKPPDQLESEFKLPTKSTPA